MSSTTLKNIAVDGVNDVPDRPVTQKSLNDDVLSMVAWPGKVWWALFVFDLIKTTSFFTLALTLSAMAAERLIPKSLMWFLVILIAVALIAAVLLGQFAKDRIGPDEITGTATLPKPGDPDGKKAG